MTAKLSIVFACAVALAAPAASAATFPANFTLDTVNSFVDITLDLNGSTSLGMGTAMGSSGTLTADIEQSGTAPPPLSMSNIQGSFDVIDFSTSGGAISLDFEDILFEIGPSAGPFPTDGNNPALVDLGGLALAIPAGDVLAFATVVYDFDATPLMFTLDPGTMGTLTESGGPLSYTVTLEIPIDLAGMSPVEGLGDLGYDLQGVLIFTGTKVVPEPGSMAILAVGLIGLVPLVRRRFRSKR